MLIFRACRAFKCMKKIQLELAAVKAVNPTLLKDAGNRVGFLGSNGKVSDHHENRSIPFSLGVR